MPRGPGRYDALATQARLAARATGLVLIVIGGRLGDGFEVQCPDARFARLLPALLRELANGIEADVARDATPEESS